MALEYFLEVSGLRGSVEAIGHQGAFAIESYAFEGANAISFGAGGGAIGRPTLSGLKVTLLDETGLTAFLDLLATGEHLPAASLIGRLTGERPTDVFRLNLGEVVVSRVHETEAGGYEVELAYETIGVLTREQKPDGSFEPFEGFGYDLVGGGLVDAPADAVPGAPMGGTGADQYFLLIDGVNGGSNRIGHVDWFEMAGFDFEIEALIAFLSGGLEAGVPRYGPVTLDLPNLGGLTTLLNRAATGSLLPGLRIEGATSDGAVYYQLTLADVFVTGVQEADGAGYRATFQYGRISLTTFTQDDSGGLGESSTFTWNVATGQSDIGSLPVLAPATSSLLPPSGEGDFYLQVEGLSGPGALIAAPGAFRVVDYAFGVTVATSAAGGSGGAGAGRPQFSTLAVSFADETGVASFLQLVANGQHLEAVSLIGLEAAPGNPERLRVNLADVVVTSVTEGDEAGYTVELAFRQIGVELTGQRETDGALQPLGSFGFDVAANAVVAPPPDADPGPVGGGTGSDRYFLLVDDVNGGATQVRHEGWFELVDFQFDVANATTVSGGGASAGRADFTPLTVEVANLNGLTQLLAKLATGAQIDGLRVQGSTNQGEVTYRLNLADVYVIAIEETEAGGYRASFAYGRVELTPFTQGSDGAFDPGTPFTWNLADNTDNVGSLPAIAPAPGSGQAGEGNAFFLEVSGLRGDAQLIGASGAFQVTSFAFEAEATAPSFGSGGATAGVTDFGAIRIGIATETGLADFLRLVASGQHVQGASLTGVQLGGGGNPEVFRINLADVVVAEVRENEQDGYQITLDYRTIGVSIRVQRPDGSFGTPQTFGYDTAAHQTVAPPPDAVPGAPIGGAGADDYVLLIDGVEGDSVRVRHAGWFELDGFQIDLEAMTAAGGAGGAGAGRTDFGPLTVHLPGVTAIQELLEALVTGERIAGLRLEGLVQGQRTYQLELADVYVTGVRDDQAGGYEVEFEYGRIRLTSYTQRPDGSITPATVFTWDVLANDADIGTLPPISPAGGFQNQAPEAPDLPNINSPEDTAVSFTVAAFTDPDGQALTYTATLGDGSALPAWLTFDAATRAFSGAPPLNFNGLLAIRVSASDGTLSASDTFDLVVTPVNDAPVAGPDAVSVDEDATTANLYAQLLSNDTDVDTGDTRAISAVGTTGTKGTVAFDAATQTLTYSADADEFDLLAPGTVVTDVFSYTVRDAAGLTSTTSVTVSVTALADGGVITGGGGAETIAGSAGEDSIPSGNGPDRVDGGAGADTIDGGTGDDLLLGGAGPDRLIGGGGGDQLFGQAGDDTLFGDAGGDTLQGDQGSDRLVGGSGGDRFVFDAAPSTAVDQIVDFGGGDLVVFRGGLAVASRSTSDFNADGAQDTVLALTNGQTLVLLSYTAWSSGDFING